MVQGYDRHLVTENLLCCHNGPALCTCDIVQYQIESAKNNQCLGIEFVGMDTIQFVSAECETAMNRNIGSWREVIYNSEMDWFQIENYGDINEPMYLCLGVPMESDFCTIGNAIELIDCSYQQNIEDNVWVAEQMRVMYDLEGNQMKLLGCDDEGTEFCVNVHQNMEGNTLRLTVDRCAESTVFHRHWFA